MQIHEDLAIMRELAGGASSITLVAWCNVGKGREMRGDVGHFDEPQKVQAFMASLFKGSR